METTVSSILKVLVFILVALIGFAVALIPAGLFAGLYWLLEPSTFWQTFAVICLGIFVFGSAQVGFLVWYCILIGAFFVMLLE